MPITEAMPDIELSAGVFHYAISGNGTPILFIHGLGAEMSSWRNQVSFFETAYRVITVDLRGHGHSRAVRPPKRMTDYAADIAEFLSRLHLPPVHVVGLSLGGMVALQLALDAPERVHRLVLVNTLADARLKTMKSRWFFWHRLGLVSILGMTVTGMAVAKKLFPGPDQADVRRTFVQEYRQNDRRMYRAAIRAIAGWCVTDRLHEIHSPVLIVAAEHDYLPFSEKQAMAEKLPVADIRIIHDSYHATPVDQSSVFNRIVLGFLADSINNTASSGSRTDR
ncbi:alpha/beta hydrolase [bacterium]|nr:alpha/beta hydrolase [candidate division CSSED10-310 bacterium]